MSFFGSALKGGAASVAARRGIYIHPLRSKQLLHKLCVPAGRGGLQHGESSVLGRRVAEARAGTHKRVNDRGMPAEGGDLCCRASVVVPARCVWIRASRKERLDYGEMTACGCALKCRFAMVAARRSIDVFVGGSEERLDTGKVAVLRRELQGCPSIICILFTFFHHFFGRHGRREWILQSLLRHSRQKEGVKNKFNVSAKICEDLVPT
jgi:hypothetical protein